jgi:hypothetical protein
MLLLENMDWQAGRFRRPFVIMVLIAYAIVITRAGCPVLPVRPRRPRMASQSARFFGQAGLFWVFGALAVNMVQHMYGRSYLRSPYESVWHSFVFQCAGIPGSRFRSCQQMCVSFSSDAEGEHMHPSTFGGMRKEWLDSVERDPHLRGRETTPKSEAQGASPNVAVAPVW